MRDPAHYLTQAQQTHPADPAPEALRLALADAAREKETYAHLLLRAWRNARAVTPPSQAST